MIYSGKTRKQEVPSQELQINFWDIINNFTDVAANVL